ncbi:hypothetical protein CALCODRAFT_337812 [Calocera cornea HHB12733]|uniref:Uncharacterized protein n=1 Tax=Calocera cornea HHB12733 TaxID=1353952 RepID=A0A165EZM4_9BASI|nr:hypothetical protein CALCODRAFT_337812 [Calocera cornea HHB12733]
MAVSAMYGGRGRRLSSAACTARLSASENCRLCPGRVWCRGRKQARLAFRGAEAEDGGRFGRGKEAIKGKQPPVSQDDERRAVCASSGWSLHTSQ